MAFFLNIGLFLPLLGFAILLALSEKIDRKIAGFIGCTTVILSFLSFATLLFVPEVPPFILYPWLHIGEIHADFVLHIDPLSHLMTLIITGVGSLIFVYSNGYMSHDEDVPRFFACMDFFVFAMLLLVLAGDLLLLFVGWEGVGLASYLLIGYWYQKPSAAQAATKAFVMNRIGDFGLLLGILLTFLLFQTTHIATISSAAGQHASMMPLLALLYFIGAIGKSAQLPLYNWLPDAMEGPTPVSALIHAATMVTAGVYLVVRMHEVYNLAPHVLEIVGIVGGVTSLFASLCALAQTDLKRVLAYSTVSQLGLMFLACGVGAYYSAMFHLTTHAFVKALLFLSAGNVVHMMHDTTEIAKMGGLSKIFTKTHWFFLIGTFALAGIPPLAPFFSKDLILEEESMTGHYLLFILGLTSSILTGVYLIRAYYLTFRNTPLQIDKTVKEAPKIMLIPVAILAVLSLLGGFLGLPIERFIDQVGLTAAEEELTHGFHLSWQLALAVLGGLFGIFLTYILYDRYGDKLGRSITLLRRSFFIDEIYWNGIALPLRNFSSLIASYFEPKLFSTTISLPAHAAQEVASQIQHAQSGQIRSYVAWMILGALLLSFYWLI